MRKIISCLLVVFLGTAGTTQTLAEKNSASIETNFGDSSKGLAQNASRDVKVQKNSVLLSRDFMSSNSFIRITSFSNLLNTNNLRVEKSCVFIYIIKNNLLNALSNEVMCLV